MTTPTPKRGEIWLVELDPTRGAEIRKTRPALVINIPDVGRLPLRIVVPITDWKALYYSAKWLVHLVPDRNNGLRKELGADAFQVKSLSEERFVRQLGSVTDDKLRQVVQAVALCIGYTS